MMHLTLLILAVLAPCPAGTSVQPYKWEVLQGLAQSSDLVVTGKVLAVVPGLRGMTKEDDTWTPTTDTRVTCEVTAVHFGGPVPKDRKITVVFGAADSPIETPSEDPLLLLLKREGTVYRLPFYGAYGVFPLKEGKIPRWFEGRKDRDYPSLEAILAKIEQHRRYQVLVSVSVDKNISRAAGKLGVKYEFTNRGKTLVWIMPPSWCFNTVACYRLIDGKRRPIAHPTHSVLRWSFLGQSEPLHHLRPGETKVFRYDIPFAVLGIDPRGSYSVAAGYRPPVQRPEWIDPKGEDVSPSSVWRGVLDPAVQTVEITD
jgi:hypothetical protein